MEAQEILKMCKSLAGRYKNQNHYEDLVSEGVLRCYEELEKDSELPVATLYRRANDAMHGYLNIRCLPVSVPKSDTARRLARDSEADLSSVDNNYNELGIELLRKTLKAEVVGLDKSSVTQPSSEELYESKEFLRLFYDGLSQELSTDEQLIFHMRFEEGMTLSECGQFFNISKEAVWKKQERMLEKVKSIVAKLQQL